MDRHTQGKAEGTFEKMKEMNGDPERPQREMGMGRQGRSAGSICTGWGLLAQGRQ